MRVLVIPEDFRKDQYLLKPLFQRLFSHASMTNTSLAAGQAGQAAFFIGLLAGLLPSARASQNPVQGCGLFCNSLNLS